MTALLEAYAERQAQALERIAAALEVLALTPAPACRHPEAEREDTGSTMGHERWRCKVCGYEVTS